MVALADLTGRFVAGRGTAPAAEPLIVLDVDGVLLSPSPLPVDRQAVGGDATVVQVEFDAGELTKGHPPVDLGLAVDADQFARPIVRNHAWLARTRAQAIRAAVKRVEDVTRTGEEFLSPHDFIVALEGRTRDDDLIVPGSSGGAITLSMRPHRQRCGQVLLTNKSLASMGDGRRPRSARRVARGATSRSRAMAPEFDNLEER